MPARSPVVNELRICPAAPGCAFQKASAAARQRSTTAPGPRPGIMPFAPDPGRRAHDEARRVAPAACRDRSREPAEIAVAADQPHLPAHRDEIADGIPFAAGRDEDLERQIQTDGHPVAAQARLLEMKNHLAIPKLGRARDAPAGDGITLGERIAAGVQRGQVALDAKNADDDEDRQADPAPRSEPPGCEERRPDRERRRRCPAPGRRLLRQPRPESDAAD